MPETEILYDATKTITEIVYDILETNIEAYGIVNNWPEVIPIWAGSAAETDVARQGLITFFQLPGPGVDFRTGVGITNYQIDIWHEDIYAGERIKEAAVLALYNYSGIIEGKAITITIDSDNGVLLEDTNKVYHYSISIGVRWSRRSA